jgi:hypothetical protein
MEDVLMDQFIKTVRELCSEMNMLTPMESQYVSITTLNHILMKIVQVNRYCLGLPRVVNCV